jgi:ketosteroid isomerase-like protein
VSAQNVEIIKRRLELANAGDWDGAFAQYRADAEYRDLQHGPDMPEVLHGVSAIGRVAAQWMEVYDEFRVEIYEYVDADPWVVGDARWYGRGKDSSVPVDVRVADAYELEDGKIARAVMGYPDVESALRGVGAARAGPPR